MSELSNIKITKEYITTTKNGITEIWCKTCSKSPYYITHNGSNYYLKIEEEDQEEDNE